MSRGMLTVVTVLAFAGAYRIYVRVTAPLTRTQIQAIPFAPREDTAPPPSLAAQTAARQYLPNAEWAADPKFTWQRGEQAFIYAQTFEPINDEQRNKVMFTPFALIWKNPNRPDEEPYVISAEKARVTFQRRFTELAGSDPGRIVGASLENAVSVRGPNGLALDGSNFVFSEETRQLYSDDPLAFHFGPTRTSRSEINGRGLGIAILLTPGSADLLGDDLPRIADFENLSLRKDVRLDVKLEQRGRLTPVTITSDDSLQFDRPNRWATFDGNVVVRQIEESDRGTSSANQLNCERLKLIFDETTEPAKPGGRVAKRDDRSVWEEKARSLESLTFHYLQATSPQTEPNQPLQRVTFRSDAKRLSASTAELQFDAFKRELLVTDPDAAVIDYDLSRLLTQKLLIGLGEQDSIDWAASDGPGRIERREENEDAISLTAQWDSQMQFRLDSDSADIEAPSERVIELKGNVDVRMRRGGSLSGQRLRLWLPNDALEQLERGNAERAGDVLPVSRILAEDRVRFASEEAEGKLQRLDVTLRPGVPPAEVTTPGKSGKTRETPRGAAPRWNILADHASAVVIVDPITLANGAESVAAEGNVRASRAGIANREGPADGPVSLTGHRLAMTSKGGHNQIVTLLGVPSEGGRTAEPAHVRAGEAHVEGQQIDVDRSSSRVRVHGISLLQWPVEADLFGRELAERLLMNIECGDGMTFDGERAKFQTKVRVSLDQSRMYCEELTATLEHKLDFMNPGRDVKPKIRDIECRDLVRIHVHEFEETQLVRYLDAELGRFKVDMETGEFTGQGPGKLDQWQKGGNHFEFAPRPAAMANRGAESTELPWSYLHLNFAGDATGNLRQQFGVVSQRVKAIYAPVEKVKTPFLQRDLSLTTPSAERAACLRCDVLKVQMMEVKTPKEGPGDAATRLSATMQAEGKATLEGHSVHANAHEMSYEESKGLLTLRGRGNEKASVYFERENETGSDRFAQSGRTIECIPASFSVRIDGAGTFSGAR